MISQNTINHIRELDCREVISDFYPLKAKGKSFIGVCPFHDDKSPSLYVYDDGYYCHACGASGKALDFVMHHKDLPFKDAVDWICKRWGISMESGGPTRPTRTVIDEVRMEVLIVNIYRSDKKAGKAISQQDYDRARLAADKVRAAAKRWGRLTEFGYK